MGHYFLTHSDTVPTNAPQFFLARRKKGSKSGKLVKRELAYVTFFPFLAYFKYECVFKRDNCPKSDLYPNICSIFNLLWCKTSWTYNPRRD